MVRISLLSLNTKYLRTKINSHEGKTNIDIHDSRIPRESSQCFYLSVILTNCVFITGKNYYLQSSTFIRCLNILLSIQKFSADEGNSD